MFFIFVKDIEDIDFMMFIFSFFVYWIGFFYVYFGVDFKFWVGIMLGGGDVFL